MRQSCSAIQREMGACRGICNFSWRAVVKLSNRDCVSLTSTRQRAGAGNHNAPSLRAVLLGVRTTAVWGRRDEDLTSVERQDAVGENFLKGSAGAASLIAWIIQVPQSHI